MNVMSAAIAQDSPARGRGRPRAFDEDEVLDTLVELFWEQGFEAASMAEISEAAGLNKSSLYNTFGSKEELFFSVLDRYIEDKKTMLTEGLAEGGIDTLVGFFEMQRDVMLTPTGARGCMAVNASTELGLRDPRMVEVSGRYRQVMRESLVRPIQRAADTGEVNPTLVDVYVSTLTSSMLGLSVAARGGASAEELNATLDSILALVQSWKV